MAKFKRCGQSLTEFAICLAVITAVIAGMQIYVRRSLQARYKYGADYFFSKLGNEAQEKQVSLPVYKSQYDPYYRESETTEDKTTDDTVGFPESSTDQEIIRQGWEKVGVLGAD